MLHGGVNVLGEKVSFGILKSTFSVPPTYHTTVWLQFQLQCQNGSVHSVEDLINESLKTNILELSYYI